MQKRYNYSKESIGQPGDLMVFQLPVNDFTRHPQLIGGILDLFRSHQLARTTAPEPLQNRLPAGNEARGRHSLHVRSEDYAVARIPYVRVIPAHKKSIHQWITIHSVIG